MLKFIIFVLFIMTFTACDPGFSVILSNNSINDQKITLTNVYKEKLRLMDSLPVQDTSQKYFYSNGKVVHNLFIKKLSDSSYFFVLEKGKQVLLQLGIGKPDFHQKVILDNNDTISLKHDKRSIIKRKNMNTSIKIRLE